MAFDKPTRNALSKMVAECRRLLTNDVREQLRATYGIQPDGTTLAVDKLAHLDDRGREIATGLREWLEHLFASEAGTAEQRRKNAFFRMAQETAFTYLNRLAALRMCEERGLVIECVRRGTESDGFALYERLASQSLGDRGQTYHIFLECMFDELAVDLGVLFDRRVPHALVFPTPACITGVIQRLNDKELAHLWKEDEAIGWLYQYFNSREEIDRMRKKELGGSPSPRNSRELAVRNQFFTPRYVVEFLTDNTLGRIWYEMQQGETVLKDECRYLVRRPNEIFLGPEEQPPATASVDAGLPQEELLKRPVYILHRAKKDPRDLKILDPACGSGHFLLYAFDLLEHIYSEAWQDEPAPTSEITGKSLRDDYEAAQSLQKDIPGLILKHNLHGIDIDPRACQIAALSLWLRAQRSYQKLGLKAAERLPITKINIVYAEPMPGEEDLLEEFIAKELSSTPEQEAIAHFVRQVFAKMKLAGEAGSLLKIEKDISEALTSARQQWARQSQRAQDKQGQASLFTVAEMDQFAGARQLRLDFSDITDTEFWEQAERRIVDALRNFAEHAAHGASLKRGLFSGDAAQGFAFIDVCRTRYDAVVMNPPFGDASLPSKPYIEDMYADTKGDVYKAFVECFQDRLVPSGMLGIISSRTGFFLGQSADWRERIVLRLYRPVALADFGSGVLDAMVETAAYVLRTLSNEEDRQLTLRLVPEVPEVPADKDGCFSIPKYQQKRGGLKRHQAEGEIGRLLQAGYIVEVPGHFRRFQAQDPSIRSAPAPQPEAFDELMCFRLVNIEDKGDQLAEMIQSLPLAQTSLVTHVANPLGTAFGRWDIRFATGEKAAPESPDPFAPLPVCPPGQLQNKQGLPITKEDVTRLKEEGLWHYPLEIPWDGILVDDNGHPDDIIGCLRQALEVIWPITASEIEHEACDLLGVKSLRDYIARPSGFFADHLKRYSKSRRKAPLYWPFSTTSGSYSVWVYYHRLTDQTLYTIINRYLEPKIEDVQRVMMRIEKDLPNASGSDATRLRDTLHEHRKLLDELQDMKQELLRVAALPYKPDLNDGVIINAAPLYKLFQHRVWAKDCADCWKKLEKGDYDWSHMAFNIWPDRVREACKKDRSLAIAHGLEDICEVPASEDKKTRKRSKSKT